MVAIQSCNQTGQQSATSTTADSIKNANTTNTGRSAKETALAEGLIRVGDEGIETGDAKVLDAYFTPDFVIHTQGGEMNLTQLKAYWDNLRTALTGFAIKREEIIVEGNMAASRSTFSGKFDKELKMSSAGPILPTDQQISWEVISTFRYNDDGRLAEEHVVSDDLGFLKKFGVDLLKMSGKEPKQ